MEKCTQDRQTEPLKQGIKDMNGINVCINLTDPQWQNTALDQAIRLSFMRSKYQPKYQATRTDGLTREAASRQHKWTGRVQIQQSTEPQHQFIKAL